MTNLLLLADGPGMDYRVLRTAASTGATVSVLGEPRSRPLGASRFCRNLTVTAQRFDAPDPGPLILEINSLVAELAIDMIVPGDPVTSRFLVHARPQLAAPAFPGPDPATYRLLNDKWRFTQFVTALGFTCPATRLLPDRAALAQAAAGGALAMPSIAKPLSESGGVGVIKLEPGEAETQIARINYEPVLWQKFVQGMDVDVNIYCEAGEVLSFIVYRREHGVYYFYDHPVMRRQLETLAARLSLTGIYNFDVVTDARLENVHWLECNPRVFFTLDVLDFVGLNYIACGLPGASPATTRDTHEKALRAIAGGRLRKASALARDTVRRGAFSPRDWAYLRHTLDDPGPTLTQLLRREGD